MVVPYSPDQGDIIMLDFDLQQGREQSGRRPALVLSPQSYNVKAGLAILCPITSQEKGYPFEVALPPSIKTNGVILVDHIKSLDYRRRNVTFVEKAPHEVPAQVFRKLERLLA